MISKIYDESEYQKGIQVSDEELAAINISAADFHGEWNYSIYENIGKWIL